MSNDIKSFIIHELERHSPLPENEQLENFDFMGSGHIDSMGIIKFVLSIEEHYGIELEPAEIESPDFCTIGGLADLIQRKTKGVQ